MSFSVAIYFVTRRYGGPEEGGWWYDAGEPVFDHGFARHVRTFADRSAADGYRDTLEATIAEPSNGPAPPLSSVSSRGRYEARVAEGEPRPFPERRPVYE